MDAEVEPMTNKVFECWNDEEEYDGTGVTKIEAYRMQSAAEEYAQDEMDEWDESMDVAVRDTVTGECAVYTVEREVRFDAWQNPERTRTLKDNENLPPPVDPRQLSLLGTTEPSDV
jgi:hypothetical protein